MTQSKRGLDLLISSCAEVGSFFGTDETHAYLREVAQEMRNRGPTRLFPTRYHEHVAHALEMVANHHGFDSPRAIASVYLATRFEFYFRILSGLLNADGTWISPQAQKTAENRLQNSHLARTRVSNVALTYEVMKLGPSTVARSAETLDQALYQKPTQLVDGTMIGNIGQRIAWARHRVGHGEFGEMAAEALFYGLLTGIIFYEA